MSASLDDVTVVLGGREVLRGFSLTVRSGERVALVGPSGCGKTTALRVLAGLQAPDSGSRSVGAGTIGMVFQDPMLLPWRTALDNVALAGELTNAPTADPSSLRGAARRRRADAREMARDALHAVGLDGHEDKLPAEMSGGMRMRVSVARALATRPSLLLLDEPFAAVDDFTRWSLLEMVENLVHDSTCAVVHVTHSLTEAVFVADRVHVMSTDPWCSPAPVEVDLPRPRVAKDRFHDDFARVAADLATVVFGESQ